MDVRLVVTGHDAQGEAIFVSDKVLPPVTLSLMPGAGFHRLWGADEPPTFPDDGARPPEPTWFPPVGGFRFAICTLPPGDMQTPADIDLPGAIAEAEAKMPGLLAHTEPDDPGMHTSDTIDLAVVLSGEIVLELDNGVEKTIRSGDAFVQNGTRHRWHNRTQEPAIFAVVLVGANRKD